MNDEQERHYPKGSMCMACAKQNNDCSKLDFAGMPVIRRDSLIHVIVQCTEFEPKKKMFYDGGKLIQAVIAALSRPIGKSAKSPWGRLQFCYQYMSCSRLYLLG